jgi:hypothetical protein
MSHLTLDVGGRLTLPVSSQQTNATVEVRDNSNSVVIESANATISSVSTTLSASCNAGSTSIAVTSAADISEGVKLNLAAPSEPVRVKKVVGTNIELWNELYYSHSSGAAVEGISVYRDVTSNEASTAFYDGTARWTVDGKRYVTFVECTMYPFENMATILDVKNEDATIYRYLDSDEDVQKGLDNAFNDIKAAIGSKGRVYCFAGSEEFIRCTVLKFLANFFRRDDEEKYEMYNKEYERLLDQVVGWVPRDVDGDGNMEDSERMTMRNIPIYISG